MIGALHRNGFMSYQKLPMFSSKTKDTPTMSQLAVWVPAQCSGAIDKIPIRAGDRRIVAIKRLGWGSWLAFAE